MSYLIFLYIMGLIFPIAWFVLRCNGDPSLNENLKWKIKAIIKTLIYPVFIVTFILYIPIGLVKWVAGGEFFWTRDD